MLPHLALTGSDLTHPALRLGRVGEGKACEESHDRPPFDGPKHHL